MRRRMLAVMALAIVPYVVAAQVPQPFPRPRDPQAPARPAPTSPSPAPPQTTPAPPPVVAPPAAPVEAEVAPTEASLGVPLYPNTQFIASYDAGRGQRFYLFGSLASFPELVKYYQTVLKNKGTPI